MKMKEVSETVSEIPRKYSNLYRDCILADKLKKVSMNLGEEPAAIQSSSGTKLQTFDWIKFAFSFGIVFLVRFF